MKTLAATALLALAWPAAGAGPSPMALDQAVDLIGRTFPGTVIAAQVDSTGGDALHHHVDMMFPHGEVGRFDVDARSGQISMRPVPADVPARASGIAEALRHAEARTGGKVMSAEYFPDPRPRYKLNVRTPQGSLVRLDLEAESGRLVAR